MFQPDVDLSTGFNFDKESNNNEPLFREIFQDILNNSYCFFTDVSKTPNAEFIGFSISSFDHIFDLKFRSTSYTSIYSLEAMAILETINQASNHGFLNFTIFSDSKSVLSALQNVSCNNKSSHLILEIRHQIKQIVEKNGSIKLIWIPSHCGIEGNETADPLAKEAPKYEVDYQMCTLVRDFKATWKKSNSNRSLDGVRKLTANHFNF